MKLGFRNVLNAIDAAARLRISIEAELRERERPNLASLLSYKQKS